MDCFHNLCWKMEEQSVLHCSFTKSKASGFFWFGVVVVKTDCTQEPILVGSGDYMAAGQGYPGELNERQMAFLPYYHSSPQRCLLLLPLLVSHFLGSIASVGGGWKIHLTFLERPLDCLSWHDLKIKYLWFSLSVSQKGNTQLLQKANLFIIVFPSQTPRSPTL